MQEYEKAAYEQVGMAKSARAIAGQAQAARIPVLDRIENDLRDFNNRLIDMKHTLENRIDRFEGSTPLSGVGDAARISTEPSTIYDWLDAVRLGVQRLEQQVNRLA